MKKAIIIGATSGIGRELAGILAANNYHVGITGRRESLLNEIKATNPEVFFSKTIDVSLTEYSVRLLKELIKEMGGMDLFIFSSGTGELNPELDFQNEKPTIETNVLGFTSMVDFAYNYFEKQNYGHLVAISSIGGLRGSRQAPAYNASKAYQINYLEGLRQKSSKLKTNVRVTDIRPGLVNTHMAKGEGLFWVMPVEKAGRQIFRAIRKKKKVAYVTKRWSVMARLLKILPGFIYNKM